MMIQASSILRRSSSSPLSVSAAGGGGISLLVCGSLDARTRHVVRQGRRSASSPSSSSFFCFPFLFFLYVPQLHPKRDQLATATTTTTTLDGILHRRSRNERKGKKEIPRVPRPTWKRSRKTLPPDDCHWVLRFGAGGGPSSAQMLPTAAAATASTTRPTTLCFSLSLSFFSRFIILPSSPASPLPFLAERRTVQQVILLSSLLLFNNQLTVDCCCCCCYLHTPFPL